MKTVTIYGHKRDVLGNRMYRKTTGKFHNRTFYENRLRLILDGGETYDLLYQPEFTEIQNGIAIPTTIERTPDGDRLTFPQGETFRAYGDLTTHDLEDLGHLKVSKRED